jgi:hypothetical protein
MGRSYHQKTMRLAFVVRLGLETRPADGLFEGWVEEVDSCIERRFRSAEELLLFLGQRFHAVSNSGAKPASGGTRPDKQEARRKQIKSRGPINKEGKQ